MIKAFKTTKAGEKLKKEADEYSMQKFLCEFSLEAEEKAEKIEIKKNVVVKEPKEAVK